MRHHRVIPQFDATYAVQTRKRGFWWTIKTYQSRGEALNHLASLNNGTLYQYEQQLGDIDGETKIDLRLGFAMLFGAAIQRLKDLRND